MSKREGFHRTYRLVPGRSLLRQTWEASLKADKRDLEQARLLREAPSIVARFVALGLIRRRGGA